MPGSIRSSRISAGGVRRACGHDVAARFEVIDHVAGAFEVVAEQLGDIGAVFDDEDPGHGGILQGPTARAFDGRTPNPASLVGVWTLAMSAVGLGFLHGLGADHLMAIAALAVDGRDRRRQRIVQTAVGFACGHTAVLAVGAIVAVVFGLVLPAALTTSAERGGGLLLVVFGLWGVWSVLTGRAYSHVHADAPRPARWHMHLGEARHGHRASALPTVMGAVFAVSSLRAVMLLEPFGASAQSLTLSAVLALIVLFGAGILLSMSIFGVLLARVLSARALIGLGRAAAGLVALASIALGIYWIALAGT